MAEGMQPICDDLEAETAELHALLSTMGDADWDRLTPADGWTARDTIAHLGFFDATATLAATDEAAFAAQTAALRTNPRFTSAGSGEVAGMSPSDIVSWFDDRRSAMVQVFRALDPKSRIPWYGPPMAATSFATARLMETWAHGQDVFDLMRAERRPSRRLRHVAHIGIRARPFSYVTNNRTVPDGEVKVVLEDPDGGDPWVWNEQAGEGNVVAGPALDFCLVVTQRRHPADTDLRVDGPLAKDWIAIAQAFAGDPGAGRRPGQFPKRR